MEAMRAAATPKQLAAAAKYAGRGVLSGNATRERPATVTTMTRSVIVDKDPQTVFDFCLGRDSFPALMPDPVRLLWTSTDNGELGGTYDFRWFYLKFMPIRWTAFIDEWEPGREFSDLQLRGMFRWFHHTHTCEPHPSGCLYTDTITFRSLLGPRLDEAVVLPQMKSLFAKRHRRMVRMLGAMP